MLLRRSPLGLSGESLRRVASVMAPPAPAPHVSRFAVLEDIAACGYEPLAAGFYRRGHAIWEVRPLDDEDAGYVLVRKREERLPDLRSRTAAARKPRSTTFLVTLSQLVGGNVQQRRVVKTDEPMTADAIARMAEEIGWQGGQRAGDTWTDGEWEVRVRGPKGELLTDWDTVGPAEIGGEEGSALLKELALLEQPGVHAEAPDGELGAMPGAGEGEPLFGEGAGGGGAPTSMPSAPTSTVAPTTNALSAALRCAMSFDDLDVGGEIAATGGFRPFYHGQKDTIRSGETFRVEGFHAGRSIEDRMQGLPYLGKPAPRGAAGQNIRIRLRASDGRLMIVTPGEVQQHFAIAPTASPGHEEGFESLPSAFEGQPAPGHDAPPARAPARPTMPATPLAKERDETGEEDTRMYPTSIRPHAAEGDEEPPLGATRSERAPALRFTHGEPPKRHWDPRTYPPMEAPELQRGIKQLRTETQRMHENRPKLRATVARRLWAGGRVAEEEVIEGPMELDDGEVGELVDHYGLENGDVDSGMDAEGEGVAEIVGEPELVPGETLEGEPVSIQFVINLGKGGV